MPAKVQVGRMRWMVAQDRIRLTGLLRDEAPRGASFSICPFDRYLAPDVPSADCGHEGDHLVRLTLASAGTDANMCSSWSSASSFPASSSPSPPAGARRWRAGPLALAPETGREPLIGEASAAAEAYGVRAGLRLGEALARCPTLRLVAPDPAGVADAWDRMLAALEGIGAAVESGRPGIAWFDARGPAHASTAARRGVIAAARRALGAPARLGAAPSRFAALAAASRARAAPAGARARVAAAAAGRLPRAAAGLAARLGRPETAGAARRRWSASASARSASSPRCRGPRWPTASARPGRWRATSPAGATRRCARARPAERLEEALELPESASGPQLERALGLLIDRLLARRERRGRTLRAVVLSAALVEGGTWRTRSRFREALADPRRMRLVLVPRLAELPAPADALRLRVEGFGPPAGDQRSLLAEPAAVARRRACARRSARRARSRARTPRCASSPSIPTRACPSAASRSRRGAEPR